MDKFLDTSKSLNEGAILFPEYAVESWGWSNVINTGLFDPDKKISKYTQKELNDLLYSEPIKVKTKMGAKDFNITYEGIVNRFTNKYIKQDLKTKSERTQKSIEAFHDNGSLFRVQWCAVEQDHPEMQDQRIQHRRPDEHGNP